MILNLAEVKRDLRMGDDDASDADIAAKILQAEGIIADYLKYSLAPYEPDASNAGELPAPIRAAILLAIRALFDGGDPLNDVVTSLLHRSRDPAMA